MSAKYDPHDLLHPYRHKACLTLRKNPTGRIYASGVKTSATCRPFSLQDRQSVSVSLCYANRSNLLGIFPSSAL